MFLCATDEHGTPAELAAAKAGKPVEKFCAEMHTIQAKIALGFRLSFDHFGRSSSVQNRQLTQHFAARLADEGLIREVDEQQVYSHADKRFLPDRYIEGTCPNCGYSSARGDQCENCTKQLNPTDLIDPKSSVSGSTDLEVRNTRHLYLCQSKMRDTLNAWIDEKVDWPILTTHVRESGLTLGKGIIGNVGGAQIKAPMMLHITNLWAKIMCLFTLFRSLQQSWDLVSPGNWSII